jgi:hypothetical protein
MFDGDLYIGDRIRSTATMRTGEVINIMKGDQTEMIVVEWQFDKDGKAIDPRPVDYHSLAGLRVWAERVDTP